MYILHGGFMVDKLKAIKLREMGKSYDEISKKLDCSVAWCKLNLRDIDKHKKRSSVLATLVEVCKQKGYLTSGDIEDMFLSNNLKLKINIGNFQYIVEHLRDALGIRDQYSRVLTGTTIEEEYIVYSAVLEGKVLYIGSGGIGREQHLLSGCSHLYEINKMHFSGIFPDVKILKTFKSKAEARNYEQFLIQKYNPCFNTKNSMAQSRNSVVVKIPANP